MNMAVARTGKEGGGRELGAYYECPPPFYLKLKLPRGELRSMASWRFLRGGRALVLPWKADDAE